ncbi:hypothetical protein [Streptomyces sp. VMFN-G11Ma]|uniref:hypothetical protein n=1 Tax=Streptomyces sp. VMFN-G11Ma TaxID=2135609 RepID=UPI000D4A1D3E|nr:hypothetical protein [Streptomyces sp. VMFN-G11Ma]PTM91202.1 hypothetical protein C7821_111177 [Streptomyces sp. VMFN-G11Ma]
MSASYPPTAWVDPDSRRAWARLITWAVLGQTLWPLTCIGILVLVVGPEWPVWLCLVPLLYSAYRTVLQHRYFVEAFQIRGILKEYAWQTYATPESGVGGVPGAKSGDVWLKLPNPERPDDLVVIILRGHIRSDEALHPARRAGVRI